MEIEMFSKNKESRGRTVVDGKYYEQLVSDGSIHLSQIYPSIRVRGGKLY